MTNQLECCDVSNRSENVQRNASDGLSQYRFAQLDRPQAFTQSGQRDSGNGPLEFSPLAGYDFGSVGSGNNILTGRLSAYEALNGNNGNNRLSAYEALNGNNRGDDRSFGITDRGDYRALLSNGDSNNADLRILSPGLRNGVDNLTLNGNGACTDDQGACGDVRDARLDSQNGNLRETPEEWQQQWQQLMQEMAKLWMQIWEMMKRFPWPQPCPPCPPGPEPVPPRPEPVPPRPEPVPPRPEPVPPRPEPVPPRPEPVPPRPEPIEPPKPEPPKPEPSDKSVEAERTKLKDALDNTLDPTRMQRMDTMMKEFEERASERVEAQVAGGQDRAAARKEWDQKIANTYRELTEMCTSDSPNAPYDKAARAKMAENCMYLVMNPANENQGQHGTCWIESQINLIGLGKHPDKMADLLNQVTTTGSYTDINGKTTRIPPQLLQISGEEAGWSIENAGNGLRSPVGAIFDRTLSYCNNGRTDGGTNGGTLQESASAIRLACGESGRVVQIRDNYLTSSDIQNITSGQYKQDFLEDGGVILLGPGHMFSSRLVNENGQWQIIGDNQWGARNDQLIGRVSNLNSWNVSQTREQYVPDHGSLRSSNYTSQNSYYNYSSPESSSIYTSGASCNPQEIIFAPNDRSGTIYDDTNPDIPGPWGGEVVAPCPTDDRHIDRQFRRERYQEIHRKMEEERRRRANISADTLTGGPERVYDDTNPMIPGPFGSNKEISADEQAKLDRQFFADRYMRMRRQLEAEWRAQSTAY